MRWWSVALAPVLLAAACSTYKVPTSHVAAARSSIGVAEQQGVSRVPAAANRLALARSELLAAHRLAQRGDRRSADLMFLRADADARLAASMAQNVHTTAETQRILQEVQQIQSQLRSTLQQPTQEPSTQQPPTQPPSMQEPSAQPPSTQPSEPSPAPAPVQPSPGTNP